MDKKEYSKKYYQEHKEECLARGKKWIENNKEKYRKYANKYSRNYYKNSKYRREYNKQKTYEKQLQNIKSWEGFIPLKTNCQICNQEIYFNQTNSKTVIHFDHKNINVKIKYSPTCWLYHHQRTPENEKIWLSCDFGMLCKRCNAFLPAKDRESFIKKVVNYVFNNQPK